VKWLLRFPVCRTRQDRCFEDVGLEEEGLLEINVPSSSKLDTEGELQSVEEAVKMLNAGLKGVFMLRAAIAKCEH